MIQIFSENPILLLFVVASLGYLLGSIKIKGNSLGVAAILFTGLAIGTIDIRLQIPEIILLIGLAIFVYSIGLSSGPAFFNSYKKNGIKDFLFIVSMLLFSGFLASLLWMIFGFSAASVAGIYAGSTTNTAALAGIIDLINTTTHNQSNQFIEEAVVGFSYSYPMGVLGGMIAIVVMEKLLNIDYDRETQKLKKEYPLDNDLCSFSIEITNPEVVDIQIRDLLKKYDWNVVFGRIYTNSTIQLTNWDMSLKIGDLIVVVGSEEEIKKIVNILGKYSDTAISHDRNLFDVRSIFVSNPLIAGNTIASLNINEKYNALVTRIRRGDIEMLAKGDTVLELGDRVRFIARRQDLQELSSFFGDSYHASSKINLFSFGLGIGLGLILGTIEFSFGDQINFKLGYAGGPLIVGLILGALRRTGPIVWTLPYSANVSLKQLGLILLLATIGVRSGNAFAQSLSMDGLWTFLAGSFISLITAFLTILVGYKIVKKPFSLIIGIVANQPAILDFATARTKNNIPVFGYTMMFPIALILKIIIAQILFISLN